MAGTVQRQERTTSRWPVPEAVAAVPGPADPAAVAEGGLRHLARAFAEGDEVAAELAGRFLINAGVSLLEVCEALLGQVAAARAGGSLLATSDAELRARRVLSRLGGSRRRTGEEVLVFTDRVDATGVALHRVLEASGYRPCPAITPDPTDVLAVVGEREWAVVVVDHVGLRRTAGTTASLLAEVRQRSGGARVVVVTDRWDDAQIATERGIVWARRDLRRVVTACGALPQDPLTDRERDVLACVAAGRSNEQIGRHLQLSLSTVKTYLERVHVKLGSVDRASAVAVALRRGWI